MNRRKIYTVRIELCVTPKMKDKIDKECKKNEQTINDLIRQAIENFLWE